MSSIGDTSAEPVMYQQSRFGRVSLFIKAAIGCLVLQAAAAAVVWGAIGAWFFGGAGPDWIHPLGIALVLAMIPATWALSNLSEPTELILHEDHLRIGGALIKRKVRYDNVRLLRLEELNEFINRSSRLIIQPRRSDKRKIALSKDDAIECFHALRQLCPQAAAIEFDEAAYSPVNEEHVSEGRKVLSRSLLGKALISASGALVLGSLAVFLLVAMIGTGSVTQRPINSLIAIGIPFLSSLALGWEAIRCLRLRASVRREPIALAGDVSDEAEWEAEPVAGLPLADRDHTAAGTR